MTWRTRSAWPHHVLDVGDNLKHKLDDAGLEPGRSQTGEDDLGEDAEMHVELHGVVRGRPVRPGLRPGDPSMRC